MILRLQAACRGWTFLESLFTPSSRAHSKKPTLVRLQFNHRVEWRQESNEFDGNKFFLSCPQVKVNAISWGSILFQNVLFGHKTVEAGKKNTLFFQQSKSRPKDVCTITASHTLCPNSNLFHHRTGIKVLSSGFVRSAIQRVNFRRFFVFHCKFHGLVCLNFFGHVASARRKSKFHLRFERLSPDPFGQ